MKRDENDVQKLVTTFDSGLLNNPFHIPDDRGDGEALVPLSNLANGVVLPESVAIRLLGASELVRQNMASFISTRIQSNETNFWGSSKETKHSTFSSVARKVTVESQKDKVVCINADRELFGRLLVVAKKREVNLKEVLSFELCSVPIALAHPGGSLRKTTKSTLMNLSEKDVTSKQNLPSSQLPTAYLFYAIALIQMVKAAGSATFGELSQKYEAIVTSTLRRNGCTRVDLIFDQYRPLSPSRLENEKSEKQAPWRSISTVDPHQTRSNGQNSFLTRETKKD